MTIKRGERNLVLNINGKYQDEFDCVGPDGLLLPKVFILPFDYTNTTKYYDCVQDFFTHAYPVPPRV